MLIAGASTDFPVTNQMNQMGPDALRVNCASVLGSTRLSARNVSNIDALPSEESNYAV